MADSDVRRMYSPPKAPVENQDLFYLPEKLGVEDWTGKNLETLHVQKTLLYSSDLGGIKLMAEVADIFIQ